MKLATIEKIIDIQPIEGADRIELAKILGYQSVIQKGLYQVGDHCVWINPDTIVPVTSWSQFLVKSNEGLEKIRIKVCKFKGKYSQGLIIPISVLADQNIELHEGVDVTEILKIEKYEKPIPACLAGEIKGNFPSFLRKTDEINLRAYPKSLKEFAGKEVYITKKYDGSSGTYYLRNGEFGVCSRKVDLKDTEGNTFWKMAKKYELKNLSDGFALQGEVYGEGINKNHLNMKDQHIVVFNVFSINDFKYLGFNSLKGVCNTLKIPMVEIVYEGIFNFTMEQLIEMSNNMEYGPGLPCEGIVIRPKEECYSEVLQGRLSGKIISEKFSLKYGE